MNCPNCKVEFEIFAQGNLELYVCPVCLSVLMEQDSTGKVLKHFCRKELLSHILSTIADPSLFEDAKQMLKPRTNLACPKCKTLTKTSDLDGRLKFLVNRCPQCGAIWLETMQVPLVAVAFTDVNNPDDAAFKETISQILQTTKRKKRGRLESLDDIIAPYIAIPLSIFGSPAGVALPIGDNVVTKTAALATKAIIATCILCFFLLLIWPDLKLGMALIAERILKGKELYRLISHVFAHAGILHLAGNMWFLWVFGRTVEDKMGIARFLLLFLTCALSSAILYIAAVADKTIPCVGASGAISGVIGAYLVLFPKAKIRFCIFGKMGTYRHYTYVYAWIYIIAWIAMNILFGLFQLAGRASGVAYWGHIGGFVSGVIFAELYKAFTPISSGLC
jgi:membrane associated rhomboid family serine protease/Zn finger protein HypA/HybF involved in hydrogenase expression